MSAAADRPRLSGWCSSAPGMRPKCRGCRAEGCECACHDEGVET